MVQNAHAVSALLLAVYVVVGAAIAVAIVLSFFVRRHGESSTNRPMRVWVDPVDGSRRYIAES